ncbi:MAG: hypothetical protein K2N18_05035, partial [Clostridia bacterium]|nr:hypothetical protein [Clostridia bacterium]
MKKLHTKRWVKIAALIGCLAIVFSFTFTFTLTDIKGGSGEEMTANAAINTSGYKTLDASYDALAHGSTYTFTDKTKVDAYRLNPTGNTDTTTIKVDRTVEHGEKENPYVINSINGNSNGRGSWNAFVTAMASDATKGSGKYFVISKDLDWKNGTIAFNCVASFAGTLYGQGHSLKNITKSFGDDANVYAGVFLNMSGIVTDLINENYSWTSCCRGGGMAGTSVGSFLNCHAKGTVSRTKTNINCQMDFGGLVCGVNTGFYAYRCSTDFYESMTCVTGNGTSCGGLVANSSGSMTVYDCMTNMSLNIHNASSNLYTGGIVGIPYLTGNGAKIEIENVYATISAGELNNFGTFDAAAGLLSGWHPTVGSGNSISYTNVYVDAKATRGGTSMTLPLSNLVSTQSAQWGKIAVTNTNINYVNSYGAYIYHSKPDNTINGKIPTTNPPSKGYANTAALKTAAADASSPLKIWDKSKISGTYSATDNAVTNKEVKKTGYAAKFYNLKNGNKESLGIADIDNYTASTMFPTPAAPSANHKFLGWTIDTDEDVYFYDKDTTFAKDIYGDVEFYAVWDVDAMT